MRGGRGDGVMVDDFFNEKCDYFFRSEPLGEDTVITHQSCV